MSRFLLSYDVKSTNPDPHGELMTQLAKVGWNTWIWAANNSQWYRLPNTTFVGEFVNYDAAKAAFDTAVAATRLIKGSVIVEKWIIVDYASSNFNSDETQK